MTKKERRDGYIQKGLCTSCGARPPIQEKRLCAPCKQSQRANQFERSAEYLRRGMCIKCGNRPIVEGRTRCEECLELHMRTHRKKKYGITHTQFVHMIREQHNECAMCRNPFEKGRARGPNIDHDHTTNEVRGILCGHCNHVLGYSFESVGILTAAIDYLLKFKKVAKVA